MIGTPPREIQSEPVTVVVLNYNGLAHLPECLSSLLDQDYRGQFEVLVWDNASSDDSVEFVRSNFPQVRLIRSDKNLGFAAGMNRAVEHATNQSIVLLNNDIRVDPDWLSRLMACARQRPDAFAIGCRLMLYDRPTVLNHAGGIFAPIGGGWDEGFGQPEAEFKDRPSVYETGIASGGAMLVKRDDFLAFGGFDERFFMYFEDVDLCLRAWQAGFPILHCADAKVFHKFGGTTGGFASPLRIYWGQRNRLRMLWRSFPTGPLAFGLAILLGWTAVCLVLGLRHPPVAGAYWRGTIHGLRDRKEYRSGFATRRAVAISAVRRLRKEGHWGTLAQAVRARAQARRGVS